MVKNGVMPCRLRRQSGWLACTPGGPVSRRRQPIDASAFQV
jgi:hypothetical protein